MTRIVPDPYSPPTSAKCKKIAEQIKRDMEAFLKNGGKIQQLESNIKRTEAQRRAEQKAMVARYRGIKNMNNTKIEEPA